MKSSPGARSWIAAGVRHELLTRALPALRHHMVAPVSVIRMGLLLLRRQLAGTAPADAGVSRVEAIDAQVGAVVEGIRSLRDWELAGPGEPVTRPALAAQCAGLLRTAFELHGVHLHIDPRLQAEAQGTPPAFAAGAALRYLLLGALCHLHDSVDDLGTIELLPEGSQALCVRALPRVRERGVPPADLPEAPRSPRALAIDAVALLSLAEDLGYRLALEPRLVRVPLAPDRDDTPPRR